MLEVDPARLAMHIVTPFVHVFEHARAAGVVELVDAHLLNLIHRIDAELLLRLEFGRQTVRVPAEHAVDAMPLHRLVPRHHVFRIPREQVAIVRQAVRKGRPVKEHELVVAVLAAGVLVNGLLECVIGIPILQHVFLELREIRVRRHIRAARAHRCLGIHMLWCFAHRCSSFLQDLTFLRGRWPEAADA